MNANAAFHPVARRLRAGGFAAVLGLAAVVGSAAAAEPALPTAPVTINIVDVAGNLALTQDAIEAYKAKHPKLVSKITFTKAPAPELPGKIQAMQAAGRTDIDLVLTGTDALAAGIELNLWQPLLPEYQGKFPNLVENYLPPARKMQELAHGQGSS